jgi:hypothetical protein
VLRHVTHPVDLVVTAADTCEHGAGALDIPLCTTIGEPAAMKRVGGQRRPGTS